MVKANHALSNSAPCSLTSEVFSRTCWVLSSPAALAWLAAERRMYINAHACRTFLYHCWENEAYTCAGPVIRFLAERHKTLVKRFAGETTAHRIITFLLSSLSAAKMIEGISQAMLTPYRTAFPIDIKSYLGTHSMNTMYPVSRRYVILHFRDAQLLEAWLALTSV